MSLAHEKVGHTGKGLWGHKSWQLPAYIQHVANDLIASGHGESHAIELAVGIVRNWAAGHDGKGGKVSADTQAKATAAMAEWESLKAKAKAGGSHRMTTYTRSFAAEVSIRSGGDGRTVDAYAAVFDVPARVRDLDGEYEEIIDPAAFDEVVDQHVRSGGIPVFYNHGMTLFGTPSSEDSLPVGVSEEIRADGRGLFTRTRFHNTPRANDVLETIRGGSVKAYSFTGEFHRSDPLVPRGGFRRRGDGTLPTVRRTASTLKEYGPTPFPVYTDAAVVGMRAEQAAWMLSGLAPGERERLAEMFRPSDSFSPETPELVPETVGDPPARRRHSIRSPREEIQQAKAEWIRKASR